MFKKFILAVSIFAALAVALLFILGTKKAQFAATEEAGKHQAPPPESVSTFIVQEQTWIETRKAIGSIEPVQGVRIDAEVAGVVRAINFENGQTVESGDLLVQLDIEVEEALLRSSEATARLAEVEFKRSNTLRESGTVPQSKLDRSVADFEKAKANMENLKAIIRRKTIRAPFSGRVGIRQINLGQYLSQGAPIVTLQSDAQVFVNFTLPQKALANLQTGMALSLQSDVYPDKAFTGKLTAISPQIDPTTRTIQLQGTLNNPDGLLRAGLFVKVTLTLPTENTVLVVPATAIVYAPYGNSIYKIMPKTDDATGKHSTVAKQSIIRIGKRRGDFVSITEGLEAGDEVVSAGAFKLRNGVTVIINNALAPTPEIAPTPDNS